MAINPANGIPGNLFGGPGLGGLPYGTVYQGSPTGSVGGGTGFGNSLLNTIDPLNAYKNAGAKAAQIYNPANPGNLNASLANTNSGLLSQAYLQSALQGQNGIGNQSNVFNQQQGLSNMLQQQALGRGPNPAMAQLNQTTGQNVANQAALMAGQRGVQSNTGLLARQSAQQGAGIQQQAVGQGATMRANQQLAAEGALQGQQANMANVAGQQVGQLANATTGYNQAAQGQLNTLTNANSAFNNAAVGMQSNINNNNTVLASNMANTAGQGSSLLSAFGDAASIVASFFQKGGMVKSYDQGGNVSNSSNQPSSFVGSYLNGTPYATPNGLQSIDINNGPNTSQQSGGAQQNGLGQLANGAADLAMAFMSKGGKAPLNGEKLAQSGKQVPGKPKVNRNSLKNDVVPAMLTPKEIVLPLSVTTNPNAPELAKVFVTHVLANQGRRAA